MSDENDFIMISSCNPEGQKINLDLPLLETPATMDFTTTMRNYHNYYMEHLGKKTIIIYTYVDIPNIHNVFLRLYENNMGIWRTCFQNDVSEKFWKHPNYRSMQLRLSSGSNSDNEFDEFDNLNDFIEMIVDYKGWNVVMITHDETKKTYHIDRIFLAK